MLTEINKPLQFEDKISNANEEEEEEEEAPSPPRRSQKSVLPSSSIYISRKAEAMEEDDGEDLVPNKPHISRLVVLYNLSDICCL